MAKPKLLSLIAALLISGILTVVLAFYFEFSFFLFIVSALIFSVSFMIVLIIMEKYIYRKIKTIHSGITAQLAGDSPGSGNYPSNMATNDVLTALESDLNRWSQERREEITRLKKLENYRKEFLGNVSHELKTPVFNIQGYILTLLDGGLEDKSINRDYLQRAEKSVERMIRIIDDLESITQMEAGELQLEIEKFDLSLLAKDVIDSLEMNAKEKNIKLTLAKYDESPVWVNGDKYRLRQVLLNLLVNSVKYGKVNGETRISFRDAGEKIMTEIADNGIGIEKKHLARIFERFYRIDKSRSREAGGTGLGLSIVEHILEAHGQTISVLSTPGVGTIFSFSLKKG